MLKPAEIVARESWEKPHTNTHLAPSAEAKLCQLFHQPKYFCWVRLC